METLDLSDLRPALIETTIVCLILLTMLDLYTIYVEVSFHYIILLSSHFQINWSLTFREIQYDIK